MLKLFPRLPASSGLPHPFHISKVWLPGLEGRMVPGPKGFLIPQASQATLTADGTDPCTPVSQDRLRVPGIHWSGKLIYREERKT